MRAYCCDALALAATPQACSAAQPAAPRGGRLFPPASRDLRAMRASRQPERLSCAPKRPAQAAASGLCLGLALALACSAARARMAGARACAHRLLARLPCPFFGGLLPRRRRRPSLMRRLEGRSAARQRRHREARTPAQRPAQAARTQHSTRQRCAAAQQRRRSHAHATLFRAFGARTTRPSGLRRAGRSVRSASRRSTRPSSRR
jgi:hypothetical protein